MGPTVTPTRTFPRIERPLPSPLRRLVCGCGILARALRLLALSQRLPCLALLFLDYTHQDRNVQLVLCAL